MARQSPVSEPVRASLAEAKSIKHLDAALRPETARAKLISVDGEEILLPDSVYRVLRASVHLMALDRAVSIVGIDYEVTTQEAANILNVSRPFFVKLLEQGELPYRKVGTRRRVRFQDLMAYKERFDTQRDKAMDKLISFSEEQGLYREAQ